MDAPLVSVIVLCYNQEDYIGECLASLVAQETEFDFEIIVSDDSSTDGTLGAAMEMASQDSRIKVFKTDENIGAARNFEAALNHSRGDLIAFCEGDDFWIGREKMQRQAVALGQNTQLGLSYTDYAKVDHEGKVLAASVLDPAAKTFEMADIVEGHGPTMHGMLMRRKAFPQVFPKSFFEVLNPDVFIIGWGLHAGGAGYIPEPLSAYRVHRDGIYSGLDEMEKRLIRYSTRIKFFECFGSEYSDLKRQSKKRFMELLAAAKKGRDSAF